MERLTPPSQRAPERDGGVAVIAVAVLLIVTAVMLATAPTSFGA